MKKHVIVVAMFLLPLIVNAQNIQTYQGVMKVPADLKAICSAWKFDYSIRKIEGEYHYYENADEDRIWHGDFWIVSDRIGYKDEVLRGTYTNGKKNGEFLLQVLDGNGEPSGLGMIVNYKNGILDGVYSNVQTNMLFNIIDSGAFAGGLIKGKIMSMHVATGLTQAVAGISPNSVMRGVVGNDGMPEGVWTVSSSGQVPIVQKRYFRKGRLIYIEERDKSTGERSICFCVFDGLTKAPDIDMIRDTNINGKECVVYDGHIAMLVEDKSYKDRYNSLYNSQMSDGLGHYRVSYAISDEISAIDGTVRKQAESWDYTYSEKAFNVNFPNIIDSKPEFIGGEEALNKYIEDNLQYPSLAKENNITGTVHVSFYVEPDGSLTDIKVKRDIGGGCGKEAVRLVQSMPKWKPGIGQVDRKPCTLKIPFKLK